MQILEDTIGFIKTLSLVDVVFFLAVLALMLLIITLIYFIRENKYEEDNSFKGEIFKNDLGIKEEKEVLNLEEENAIIDLQEITKALEQAQPMTMDLDIDKYESEQEEKAIISYDELLKRKNDFALNYTEEEKIDEELSIKKVDLDNLLNKEVEEPNNIKVTVIAYEKEEAFLQALKTLQQNLN